MKKIFTLFLALVATTALWAYDFEVDGIYYDILTDKTNEVNVAISSYSNEYSGSVTIPSTVTYNGITYSVTSIGDHAFSGCESLTSITIPNSVTSIGSKAFYCCRWLTSVTIGNSVTSIGELAFVCCERLTSIEIPNSVTSIGSEAFYGSGLTSVTLPNSVTSIGELAFADCSGLTSIIVEEGNSIYDSRENCNAIIETNSNTLVAGCKNTTIPNSVTSIGDHAFSSCSGLKSVTLPNSVTSIGESAFYYCRGLTFIEIPNSVTSIGYRAFEGCPGLKSPVYNAHCFAYMPKSFEGAYSIPEGVKQIAGGAFYECSGLKSITIPNSVTSIGDDAFYYCDGLKSITILNSVTSIGNSAFAYCYGLTSVTLGNSVTSIGDDAFYSCASLTSITIPNSVTNIGGSAFRLCVKLTSVTIPNSVTSIGDYAFGTCESLKFITIPNSVTSIGESAFAYCESLTSITIPNSVTSIGESAFSGCESLTSITIPNSVTSIGESTFSGCSDLKSITIPNSVTSIGKWAFYECRSLTSINVFAEVPPTLGTNAFYNVSTTIPVYVPCGSVSAYQSAEGWNAFTNIQEFVIYSIEVGVNDSIMGTSRVDYNTCSEGAQITAIPNYGYHFVQWSDGITENLRTLVLTQDTTLTAEFAPNQYAITTTSSQPDRGTTRGDTMVNYLEYATLSAEANYGYHFSHWMIEKYREYSCIVAKFSVPDSWENPTAWVWETGGAGSWQDLSYEYGMYVYRTCNSNMNILIARDYYYSDQTEDLALTESCCYTIDKFSNVTKTYDCLVDSDLAIQVDTTMTITSTISTNPLQVIVRSNQNAVAYFDKNTYSITKNCNSEHGYIDGMSSAEYLDLVTLTAIPNYGYHFTQWSDGETDNPRTLVLTQDTTLTAEFAPNQYAITTTSSQPDRGTTRGDTMVNYLEYATLFAEANYGYHFTKWNDSNTSNPRTVQVTEDKNYTAYFDKNTYSITKNCNSEHGYIDGMSSAEYLDQVTLTAIPNLGYEFVRWSDGNTSNPRIFTLTQDTAFTAEFAVSYSGQCGDNLYWAYDENNKTILITGSGDMYDYSVDTVPWLLFKEQIMEVTTSNTATSIGTSAFEGCVRLAKVSLGSGMVNIAANAFAGCTCLYDIYCYAYPPFAEESSFANYNVYVYIPCEYQRAYTLDVIWGKFKFIECIAAESDKTDGDNVTITPGSNDVTITWPTDPNAETYVIVIKQGDKVFCSLTFNADGMLLNIAFAPSRSGSHPVTYAASTGNGLRFTVTSLEESTTYGYDITTKDEKDNTLSTYTGEFTTKSNSSTSVSDIQSPMTNCQKLLRNGQLLILREGKTYNVMGAQAD